MEECVSEEILLAFVEGELDEDEQERLHRHLDGCPACLGLVARIGAPDAPRAPALPIGPASSSEELAPSSRSSSRPAPSSWTPPQQFGEFRLLRPLGRGAMGQVYLGHDTQLDRRVAIKFLANTEASAGARERLFVEARAIARLQHSNVVAIHRVGEVDQRPYLVSEFVAGKSLDRVPTPMPWQHVLGIGLSLARGLAAAHRRGVLHRDIKPANVILADGGEAKLLDFGLAKLTDDLSRSYAGESGDLDDDDVADTPVASMLTQTGTVLGTPHYMAPEVWRGDPATARSDIYSMGVLLYRLCSGQEPYCDERSARGLRRAVLKGDPPPLRREARDVDPALAEVIHRCLRRDPEERYPSAEELRLALQALHEGASRRASRPRVVWVVAGITGLLTLGLLGMTFLRSGAATPAKAHDAPPLPPPPPPAVVAAPAPPVKAPPPVIETPRPPPKPVKQPRKVVQHEVDDFAKDAP